MEELISMHLEMAKLFFHEINTSNPGILSTIKVSVENPIGKSASDEAGILYILTSTGFPDYVDGVARIDLSSQTVVQNWYKGSGFYGIGYDPPRSGGLCIQFERISREWNGNCIGPRRIRK